MKRLRKSAQSDVQLRSNVYIRIYTRTCVSRQSSAAVISADLVFL